MTIDQTVLRKYAMCLSEWDSGDNHQLCCLWNLVSSYSVDEYGLLHSYNDKPALCIGNNQKIYFNHGMLHRLSGYAIEGHTSHYYIHKDIVYVYPLIQHFIGLMENYAVTT